MERSMSSFVQKEKAAYPFYSEYTIPAGTYTGQTEEVKTLSVQAVLLAGDSLSENTVKELTELLFLHGKDIRYAASIELKEDEQSAIGGITIPFHKGAAAYYAECGIEVPTKEKYGSSVGYVSDIGSFGAGADAG